LVEKAGCLAAVNKLVVRDVCAMTCSVSSENLNHTQLNATAAVAVVQIKSNIF